MNLEVSEIVNAKKERFGLNKAIELTTAIKDLYVSKGKKVLHIDLSKSKPNKDELENLMLGPTGNLRAPTIKSGKTLIVGFNDEAYKTLLNN